MAPYARSGKASCGEKPAGKIAPLHFRPKTSGSLLKTCRVTSALKADSTGHPTLTALRSRALLLVGWVGALRRTELITQAIRVGTDEGLGRGALPVAWLSEDRWPEIERGTHPF